MAEKTYTGSSLEQALTSGSLERASIELVGMVKASEKVKHISFAKGDCETWIDLPTDLIDQAEHLDQRPCKDHVHPVFKITLKEPKDPTAQILGSLLSTPVSTSSQYGTLPIQSPVTQPFSGTPAFQSQVQPRQWFYPTASEQGLPTEPLLMSAPYVVQASGGRSCVRYVSCIGAGVYTHCTVNTVCVGLTSGGQLDVSVSSAAI